ncbi:MAG: hypothetical protein MUD16_00085 [Desulfobacterales bacterium]|jgi:NAD(P)H-nitrite reductase large subunit|nr:hypothetical protein [Desulfobacterales bacterium]
MTGRRATAIDPEVRTVARESGRTLGYDQLERSHGSAAVVIGSGTIRI